MGSVIVTLLCFAVMLTGAQMISQSSFSSADMTAESWKQMEERLDEISSTSIASVEVEVVSEDTINIIIVNDGILKLSDFASWDVIIQYYLENDGGYEVTWLPYTSSAEPGDDEWTVMGIYMDESNDMDEVFEPGILNPGEEVWIKLKLSQYMEDASTKMVTINTPNGVTLPIIFT